MPTGQGVADLRLHPRGPGTWTENQGVGTRHGRNLDRPARTAGQLPRRTAPAPPARRRQPGGPARVADDLARSLSALKIRVQPHDPKTSLVSPEKARENTAKEIDRLLGTAVYLQRHAHAAMLGRCVLGADSKEDCSTEGAHLQLNVWDDTTRRDIAEDGTTGCVAHTVEAARRIMADPASRKILLAFVHDGEGAAVSRALGLGSDDTEQFLNRGLTLRPEHRVS